MQHYGDIKELSGYTLPIVDVITGGSPCQDLSIAKGNRDGLAGERSGLFLEQIRIVREMRERDRADGRTGYLIRPRFMVWENVPGAFSSNKGKDFQTVLTEIVRIAEPDAPVVPLPRSGKWQHSGCLYDELGAWSIAWRLHDAQFWGATQFADDRMLFPGTPQRRKRIALVADFGGRCAAEVLFERNRLHWHSEESGAQGKDLADGTEEGTGETGKCLNPWDVQSKHIQSPDGVSETLYAGECRGGVEKHMSSRAISFQERAGKPGGVKESSSKMSESEHCPPSISRKYSEPLMIEMTSTKNTIIEGGVSHTLTQRMGTGGNQVNAVWKGENE